jgi:UDP-4-amino-4,6-dideoxy-N-acetyl-beta-L-altrosamine N-acetyltransferase
MIVEIKRISQGDRASLREWRNDPEVTRWGYSNHVISEEEHNAWFDAMLVDASKVYWKIIVEGIAVGAIFLRSISDQSDTDEWGMYLADADVRGKGVAQAACALSFHYAFNELDLEVVNCEAFAQNEDAIGIYESVGSCEPECR